LAVLSAALIFISVVLAIPSIALTSIRHSGDSFRRFDLSFRRSSLLSVALTSIRHSGGSFRRSDLSFRRSGLYFRRSSHSFHRSDFYPSLWRFFPSL